MIKLIEACTYISNFNLFVIVKMGLCSEENYYGYDLFYVFLDKSVTLTPHDELNILTRLSLDSLFNYALQLFWFFDSN